MQIALLKVALKVLYHSGFELPALLLVKHFYRQRETCRVVRVAYPDVQFANAFGVLIDIVHCSVQFRRGCVSE